MFRACLGVLLLWLCVPQLGQNIGVWWLNRGLLLAETDPEASAQQLAQAQAILDYWPDDRGSQRARANIAITQHDLITARTLWQASGETARLRLRGDALGFIGSTQRNHVQNAMNWYVMAEPFNQENAEFWFEVGRLCRVDPTRDPLCDRSVIRNKGNLLLNADFSLGLAGWSQHAAAGSEIALADCAAKAPCVRLETHTATPPFAASLFQCVAVEAGEAYLFSAEISTRSHQSADDWRPVYAQGAVSGEAQGIVHSQPSMGDTFHTFTNRFTAASYDDGLICLHLARVRDAAEIIIRNPRFVKEADP